MYTFDQGLDQRSAATSGRLKDDTLGPKSHFKTDLMVVPWYDHSFDSTLKECNCLSGSSSIGQRDLEKDIIEEIRNVSGSWERL